MDKELKPCRYRVEKTGYGFWPYCVRAGDGTRELFKGHQKQCMVVAAELETAFEDGKFVADRANACQGGEAVAEYQQLSRYGNWDRIDKVDFDLGILGSCPEKFRALYTHPADQVPESMRALLQQIADNKDASHFIGDLQAQLRALLEQKP